MMELMEAGYRKLYRWVSAECRVFERDAPELPTLLVSAFDALQERPVLLKFVSFGFPRHRFGADDGHF